MTLLSLREQVGFYAAYHHNNINKWIHITCVPLILWSALVFTSYSPTFFSIEDISMGTLPIAIPLTVSTIFASIYFLLYVALEPVAGITYSFCLFPMLLHAHYFSQLNPNAISIALYIHIFSWLAQFIGHGVFERRAPALLDSFIQSFLMAPFFVWLETLFMFGYRPDLAKEIESKAMQDIKAFENKSG